VKEERWALVSRAAPERRRRGVRVREEPDEGKALCGTEEEPDRTRAGAAVNIDAAPPPTPSLQRLHRRPAVSIATIPFSLTLLLPVRVPSCR
jgi:hypothetical protein